MQDLGSSKSNTTWGLFKRETLINCPLEIISQAQKSSFYYVSFLFPWLQEKVSLNISWQWLLLEHPALEEGSWWGIKALSLWKSIISLVFLCLHRASLSKLLGKVGACGSSFSPKGKSRSWVVLDSSEAQIHLLLDRVVCTRKRAEQEDPGTPSDMSTTYSMIRPWFNAVAVNALIMYFRHMTFFPPSTSYCNNLDDSSQIQKEVMSHFTKYNELFI